MGSFNETCAVSGLPVAWETPCRLFVIRPHSYLPLHYQSVWEPMAIVPFKGVYDDYGKLTNTETTPAFEMQHKILRVAAREFPEETREHHWEIFKRYPDDPSALYELCERGVLEVFTPHGNFFSAPFYVREDVYQLVIEQAASSEDWRGKYTDRVREIVGARFKHWELWREYMARLKDKDEDFDSQEHMHKMVEVEDQDNGYGRHLGKMMLLEHWEEITASPELRTSLEEAMIEFELFSDGLDLVHGTWQPKLVRGQESDYEFHAKWHRTLAGLADEAHRRREEDL